ncbi:hypothetical protein RRG08_007160 [Elysia crispata]|uniref:Uncharacterized protein n=1 Tax=Elysia crispata TaxID=231223 RepID=A0AAE0YHU5_9GAST|nr:hypothetical protein RRG08_007160 [Elysia crispata]
MELEGMFVTELEALFRRMFEMELVECLDGAYGGACGVNAGARRFEETPRWSLNARSRFEETFRWKRRNEYLETARNADGFVEDGACKECRSRYKERLD